MYCTDYWRGLLVVPIHPALSSEEVTTFSTSSMVGGFQIICNSRNVLVQSKSSLSKERQQLCVQAKLG